MGTPRTRPGAPHGNLPSILAHVGIVRNRPGRWPDCHHGLLGVSRGGSVAQRCNMVPVSASPASRSGTAQPHVHGAVERASGHVRSGLPLHETALTVLIGLAALVVYFSASAPYPAWSTPAEDIAFSPPVPSAVQYLQPIFGTPDTGGYHIAGLLARAVLALPIGSDTARLQLMAAALGAVTVMLGVLILRRLGCGWGPAMAGGLALMFSGTMWFRAVAVQPGALTASLLLGTVLSLFWWVDTRRPGGLWLMAGLYALGVGCDLTVAALLPGLVVFLRMAVTQRAERFKVVGLCLAATAVGVLHHEVAMLETWCAAPALQLEVAGGAAPSGTYREVGLLGRFFTEGPITTQLSVAGRLLTAEFGLLGVGLLVAGITTLVRDEPRAAMLFGVSTIAVIGWALIAGSPGLRASLPVAFLLMWPLVGVGMSWLTSICVTRASRAFAFAVLLILPASTLFVHFNSISRAERSSQSHYFDRVFEALPEKTAIVAESDDFDRALTYAGYARRDGSVLRVPRDPAQITRVHRLGFSVFASDGGRAWLERLGLGFASVRPESVPMTLSRYLETIPRGAIVAAAAGPGLTRAIEPSETRAFGGIGGTADLFGGRQSFYGIVGVRNTRRGIVERLDTVPVDLQLAAGDPIGVAPVRAMVTLRIRSDEQGGRIDVNGQPVAHTRTGLALVVLSPDGRLLDTHAIEYAGSLRVPVRPGGPSLARLYGWEPCREVGSKSWVDMSAPAAGGRVGVLFGSAKATAEVVIYWAGNHPLRPRVDAQPGWRPVDAEVESFRTVEPGAVESLRRGLGRDRFPDHSRLDEYAHVYRLHIHARDLGQRLLSVSLDGFPDRAFARVEQQEDPAASLRFCGALSGIEPLLADNDASSSTTDVALDNSLLFPYGWHGVERDGPTRFRWTAAPEAEVVVEVARTGHTRVQIEASFVGASTTTVDPTLSLQVNEVTLSAHAMRPGTQVYSWLVPADVWKVGANRFRLGVSHLVIPAEVSQSQDERLLGAAVRMIRLELLDTE